jgi:excisionase family DNA binding protein
MDDTQDFTYYTSKQIAEKLNVCVVTAERFARKGTLPAVKIGRSWYFPAKAIDQLLSVEVGGSDVE